MSFPLTPPMLPLSGLFLTCSGSSSVPAWTGTFSLPTYSVPGTFPFSGLAASQFSSPFVPTSMPPLVPHAVAPQVRLPKLSTRKVGGT